MHHVNDFVISQAGRLLTCQPPQSIYYINITLSDIPAPRPRHLSKDRRDLDDENEREPHTS